MKVIEYTEYGLAEEKSFIDAVVNILNEDKDNCIDFTGVHYFTTSFFNTLFNRLMSLNLMDKFLEIKVIGLNNVGSKVYSVCLDNVLKGK